MVEALRDIVGVDFSDTTPEWLTLYRRNFGLLREALAFSSTLAFSLEYSLDSSVLREVRGVLEKHFIPGGTDPVNEAAVERLLRTPLTPEIVRTFIPDYKS